MTDKKLIADKIGKSNLAGWDDIPDIGLYMDQVITVLNGLGETAKAMTPNMINNYVKDGHIDRPLEKKYSREQMMRLQVMMQLKPVLAIPDISRALKSLGEDAEFRKAYESLAVMQKKAAETVAERIGKHLAEENPASDSMMALQLSFEASVLRMAAELLLRNEEEKKSGS